MKEYLIVDGYNIIGAWPELQKLKGIGLAEARDRLIDILADYQAYSGMIVFLIFDAYQVPGKGGKYEHSKLHVQFTREKETADEVIERLVTELSARRVRIYVATSDMAEQHVIFGKGALRIPARELRIMIQQNRADVGGRIRDNTDSARNTFDSKLSLELRQQFEKWRRGE